MGALDEVKHLGIRIDRETPAKVRYTSDYYCRSINRHVVMLVREDIRKFEREAGKIGSRE